jgi:DNA-binding MarR family transcriptional regulator
MGVQCATIRGAMEDDTTAATIRDRFGYLLKHARERLAALSAARLEPFGVNGREVAVLSVLAEGKPPSQLEAAQRLAIDRTTMVALLDALERRGLVERRADPADRRRNIVVLTTAGHETLIGAARATDEAEEAFLAPISIRDRARLRRMLQALISGSDEGAAR